MFPERGNVQATAIGQEVLNIFPFPTEFTEQQGKFVRFICIDNQLAINKRCTKERRGLRLFRLARTKMMRSVPMMVEARCVH
jgi:hypothetical protein